jgi:hypothetical protein
VSEAPLRPAAVFAAALLGLVGSTYAAWHSLPGFAGRSPNISLAERPADGSYYLAHDRGGHLDHHVLYHGIDAEALAHLKNADLLFVGNSRLMFGLRSEVLAPWAAARGVAYYAFGFGYRDGDDWALELIRKLDLRPRVVVVNVDGFFARPMSSGALRVRRDPEFGARKLRFEGEVTHEARRVVHRIIPNWLDLYGRPGFTSGDEFIAYRSRRDGGWAVSPWPAAATPAASIDFQNEPVGPRIGDAARAFKAELDARGSQMVLTYVPTPDDSGGNPVALGTMLGVPVVGLGVAGLSSHDGSHLSEESALAWSRRLTDDLAPHLPVPR